MYCVRCRQPFPPNASLRCRRCGYSGLSPWSGLIRVLLVVGLLIALVGIPWLRRQNSQLQDLSQQTGMQWDREMSGPWTRSSLPSQVGIEIYRIHIVDQKKQAMHEHHRTFSRGDHVVATFHFRTQRPDQFQPRAVLTGPSTISARLPKPLTHTQGDYRQFHSVLIPWVIPSDALPGKYQLRLEVEEAGAAKAFWETDWELR